jgi:hypothetical protein
MILTTLQSIINNRIFSIIKLDNDRGTVVENHGYFMGTRTCLFWSSELNSGYVWSLKTPPPYIKQRNYNICHMRKKYNQFLRQNRII